MEPGLEISPTDKQDPLDFLCKLKVSQIFSKKSTKDISPHLQQIINRSQGQGCGLGGGKSTEKICKGNQIEEKLQIF